MGEPCDLQSLLLRVLLVLYAWGRRHLTPDAARITVLLAAFVPLTPYFVAFRAASLFVLLSALSLDAVDRLRWSNALAWGALAGLARPPGIVLVVPFAVGVWLAERRTVRRLAWLAGSVAFGSGFAVLAVVDHRVSGNALAFLKGQEAWGKRIGIPFASELRAALSMHTFTALVGAGAALVVSAVGLVAAPFLARLREWRPAAAYLAVTIVLSNASTTYLAIPRFIVEAPPLFFGLALIAQRFRWEYGVLLGEWEPAGLYSALWTLGVKGVRA